MSLLRKSFITLFILVVFLLSCFFLALYVFPIDIPAPDYSSYHPILGDLKEENNAAFYLRKAAESLKLNVDGLCEQEVEVVYNTLPDGYWENCQASVKQLGVAASLKEFRLPRAKFLESPHIDFGHKVGELLSLLKLNAYHFLQLNQVEMAKAEFIKVIALSNVIVSNAPGETFVWRVDRVVADVIEQINKDARLKSDSNFMKLLARKLSGLNKAISDGVEYMAKTQWYSKDTWLANFSKSKFTFRDLEMFKLNPKSSDQLPFWAGLQVPKYLFKLNETRELYFQCHQKMMQLSRLNITEREAACEKLEAELKNDTTEVENVVGKAVDFALFELDGIVDVFDTIRINCRLNQVRVALQRFYLKNGTYPENPIELVPHFLRGFPRDPVDGKPIRVDVKNRKVYSIGKRVGSKRSGYKRKAVELPFL